MIKVKLTDRHHAFLGNLEYVFRLAHQLGRDGTPIDHFHWLVEEDVHVCLCLEPDFDVPQNALNPSSIVLDAGPALARVLAVIEGVYAPGSSAVDTDANDKASQAES